MVSANSSTSAGGLASAAMGMRPTRNGASQAMTFRSACTRRATDGRWTLTTTRSPVTRVAACTWAIDAAARGVRSMSANTASEGPAELRLDDGADLVPRLGRDLVAALLELGDQLLGEQALAARDDLAELDVGRPELLGGDAQAPRDVRPRLGAAPPAGAGRPPGHGQAEMARHAEDARARRQAPGPGQLRDLASHDPPDVGDRLPPRHLLGSHQPGGVVAERPDGQVGGEVRWGEVSDLVRGGAAARGRPG